jgi:STE24 endopeptidase
MLSAQSAQHYSLPPDKLQRAIEYAHAGYWLHFGSELLSVAILAAIIVTGFGARLRDWAEVVSKWRFVQALIFVPLLLAVNDLLYLPANIYGQHLELKFDQSIQSWPSWFWDWTKTELITLGCAVPIAFLLFAVIRRSPRRWWLYFWLATLPIIVAVMYLEPMIIEPIFYRFQPLTATHPTLVDQLEALVARAGLSIPRDRMFEM